MNRRRDLLKLAAGGSFSLFASAHAVAQTQPVITTILRNARITTMDAATPEAEALAISDGRIAAVGSDAEVMKLAGPTTAVIDCQRRRVIPGLHDGHTHPIRGGLISRDKDRGRAANGECAVRSARPERACVAGGPSRK